LSKNAGSGSVLSQSGSTTLRKTFYLTGMEKTCHLIAKVNNFIKKKLLKNATKVRI
jgi:hypothetical protein